MVGGSPSAVALAVTIHDKISLHQNLNGAHCFYQETLDGGKWQLN